MLDLAGERVDHCRLLLRRVSFLSVLLFLLNVVFIKLSLTFFSRVRSLKDATAKAAIRILVHPVLMFVNKLVNQIWTIDYQNTTPYLATGSHLSLFVFFECNLPISVVLLRDDLVGRH